MRRFDASTGSATAELSDRAGGGPELVEGPGANLRLLMPGLPRSAHQSTGAVAGLCAAKSKSDLSAAGFWGTPIIEARSPSLSRGAAPLPRGTFPKISAASAGK